LNNKKTSALVAYLMLTCVLKHIM